MLLAASSHCQVSTHSVRGLMAVTPVITSPMTAEQARIFSVVCIAVVFCGLTSLQFTGPDRDAKKQSSLEDSKAAVRVRCNCELADFASTARWPYPGDVQHESSDTAEYGSGCDAEGVANPDEIREESAEYEASSEARQVQHGNKITHLASRLTALRFSGFGPRTQS